MNGLSWLLPTLLVFALLIHAIHINYNVYANCWRATYSTLTSIFPTPIHGPVFRPPKNHMTITNFALGCYCNCQFPTFQLTDWLTTGLTDCKRSGVFRETELDNKHKNNDFLYCVICAVNNISKISNMLHERTGLLVEFAINERYLCAILYATHQTIS